MDTNKIFGLLLVLVIGLALTPSLVTTLNSAKYGVSKADTFSKTGAGTTKSCSLWGNIRNDTDFITVIVTNVTATPDTITTWTNYAVTGLGSYAANSTLVVSGLTANDEFTIAIDYKVLLPAVQVALLTLLPLLWVVAIIAIMVVVIAKEVKF